MREEEQNDDGAIGVKHIASAAAAAYCLRLNSSNLKRLREMHEFEDVAL